VRSLLHPAVVSVEDKKMKVNRELNDIRMGLRQDNKVSDS
jgi:hypothetical protein